MRLQGDRVGIAAANPATLLQVLNATCNGTSWNDACSRELKQDITALETEEARRAVMSLAPVKYSYKSDPGDARVGFIAEDAPELVATPDRRTLSSMDIVAALTRVVQEQDRKIAELEARLNEMSREQ
ncbi:MAG: tail fiber domain-containing protein [Planctomycetaceae bacterium]